MALGDACTERGRLKGTGDGKGADLADDMMAVKRFGLPTVGLRKGGGDDEGRRRHTRYPRSGGGTAGCGGGDGVRNGAEYSWVVGRSADGTAERNSRGGEGDAGGGGILQVARVTAIQRVPPLAIFFQAQLTLNVIGPANKIRRGVAEQPDAHAKTY